MAKTKKATKKSGKRKRIVAEARESLRKACPHVMMMTGNKFGTLTADASGKAATRLESFLEAKAAWMETFRGGDTSPLAVSKFFDPNIGLLTDKQFDDLTDALLEGESVTVPSKYNPVQVEVAHALNCRSIRRGQPKNHPKPPKEWDDKEFGPWWDEYEDEEGNVIREPSGMYITDELPRMVHADKAEDLVVDPDVNILTFGNLRIVCGDGTHDNAAVFLVRAHKGGNYGQCDITRKRLSLAGKPVKDVVFRIEDRANNGGAFVVKGRWVSGNRLTTEIPFLTGQVLTAGHLYDSDGNQLDAKAIRKLDGDTKGLKFKALEAPIKGKDVPYSDIWGQISQDRKGVKALRERDGRSEDWESGNPRQKTITNIRTISRTSPFAAYAFGFKSVQADIVPYTIATGEGSIEQGHFMMGVVVGARSADEYNVGVHAASADDEKPKAAKPKAKKASKPKAEKKAAKPEKGSKKSKSKKAAKKPEPVAVDAAPPVEVDSAAEDEVSLAEALLS